MCWWRWFDGGRRELAHPDGGRRCWFKGHQNLILVGNGQPTIQALRDSHPCLGVADAVEAWGICNRLPSKEMVLSLLTVR